MFWCLQNWDYESKSPMSHNWGSRHERIMKKTGGTIFFRQDRARGIIWCLILFGREACPLFWQPAPCMRNSSMTAPNHTLLTRWPSADRRWANAWATCEQDVVFVGGSWEPGASCINQGYTDGMSWLRTQHSGQIHYSHDKRPTVYPSSRDHTAPLTPLTYTPCPVRNIPRPDARPKIPGILFETTLTLLTHPRCLIYQITRLDSRPSQIPGFFWKRSGRLRLLL